MVKIRAVGHNGGGEMISEEMENYSLREFLQVIFKRKKEILRVLSACVAAAIAYSLVASPVYQASAKLMVKAGRASVYVPTLSMEAQSNTTFLPNREEQINTEIDVLKNQFIAREVVQSDGLGPAILYKDLSAPSWGLIEDNEPIEPLEKAAKRLLEQVTVERVPNSSVIEVRFEHSDPRIAAKVVNNWIDSYLDYHLKVHQNPKVYEFYRKQVPIIEVQLKEKEDRLAAFVRDQGVTSPSEEQVLSLRNEADLRAELGKTVTEEREIRSRVDQLKRVLAGVPKSVVLSEEVGDLSPVVNTLESKLVELEVKEKELRGPHNGLGVKHPVVQSIQIQIKLVRAKLAEQKAKSRGTKSRSGINPVYQGLQEDLYDWEIRLKGFGEKLAAQQEGLNEHRQRLDQLNSTQAMYENLRNQVLMARKKYHLYLTTYDEFRISNAMLSEKINNVTVIDTASPPTEPIRPRTLLNFMLSLVIGSFGGICLALLREYLSNNLESDYDVEAYLGIPVLASIPVHMEIASTVKRLLLPSPQVKPV